MKDQRNDYDPRAATVEVDPFDRFNGPNDELLFALGFRSALRACEIAGRTVEQSNSAQGED